MKKRIQEIINQEQLSASDFANKIGVQRSSISHILSGRNNPSLEVVQKILTAFSTLNSEWLLFGRGAMYKNATGKDLFSGSTSIYKEEQKKLTKPVLLQEESNNEKNQAPQNKEKSTPEIKESANKDLVKTNRAERIIIFNADNTFIEYKSS